MTNKEFRQLRTVNWVAELLDVSPNTVRNWIATDQLPSVKIIGLRRIYEDDVYRLIEEGHQQAINKDDLECDDKDAYKDEEAEELSF